MSVKTERVKLWVGRLVLILSGLAVSLAAIEIGLRLAGVCVVQRRPVARVAQKPLIIFAGDSWTYGNDAVPGKGFFDLVRQEPAFAGMDMVNKGVGANNYFQITTSILDHPVIPRIVVTTGGINFWHLLGKDRFLQAARPYLSDAETNEFCRIFFIRRGHPAWIERLRLYKLFRYFAGRWQPQERELDVTYFNQALGSKVFWDLYVPFGKEHYSKQEVEDALPGFLNEHPELTLDQKFYFVALHFGFNQREMERVLRKAGMFYPQRLTVVPYRLYGEIGISGRPIPDMCGEIISWSFKVLSRWAREHNVTVFVQTYPDIRRDMPSETIFVKANANIAFNARRYGLGLIDHNAGQIDWIPYRTLWHVNTEGHQVMEETIKKALEPYLEKSTP